MKYAIVEIAGKQVKIEPNKEVLVHFLGEVDEFESDKVLLISGDKLQIGSPFLKDKLKFKVLGTKKVKTRVATYSAKANSRTVVGSKAMYSKIMLVS